MAVGNTVGFVYVQVFADTVNFGRQVDRQIKDHESRWSRSFYRLRNWLRRTGTGGFYDTITNSLAGMLTMARGVGTIFTGSFGLAGKAVSGLGDKMTRFITRNEKFFGSLAAPLANMSSQVFQLGGGLSSLGGHPLTAVLGIVVAIGAFQVILSLAVTAVSALTAGVVALGSAIYYTIAATGILVPLVGALGVGLAATVVGALDAAGAVGKLWTAINETDAKKRAKAFEAFNKELAKLGPNTQKAVLGLQPLIEGFKDLRRDASEALFKGMDKALRNAEPLVEAIEKGLVGVAEAVGNVVDHFLNLGKNEVFLANFNKMWESAAKIVESFGKASVNLFEGLTNFFAAVSPLTERFADALARAFGSFADWAGSAAGQESITNFFTTAYEMASGVWEIIKELGSALHNLFTAEATVGAAQDFLGFILEKIETFNNWITTVSENGKLQEWFDFAREAGAKFWDVLSAIGDFLKSLDTPENRKWLITLLEFIELTVKALQIMFTWSSRVFNGLLGWIRPVISAMKTLVDWFKKASDAIPGIIGRVGGWVGGIFGRSAPTGAAPTSAQVVPIGTTSSAMTVNNWNITTPGMDARVVASQVLNRSVAMAG